MSSWKERVYALLLRRVLGPWLTPRSLAHLHESLSVSIGQGEYVLTNLDLNVDHVASKVPLGSVGIVSASVGKVHVQISLLDDEPDETQSNTSLAWRAFKLAAATETTAGSVALVVHVQLEDVCIILEPSRRPTTPSEAPLMPLDAVAAAPSVPASSVTSTVSGLITSYLEAALASLRLSVTCQSMRVRLQTNDATCPCWMEVRAQSAIYQDANRNETSESNTTVPIDTTYATMLHKTLDVTRITLVTSTPASPQSTVVALLEGTSQCRLRVIEYNSASNPTNEKDSTSSPLQQQDIQVNLNQKLNVSIEATALDQVRTILHCFQQPRTMDDLESSHLDSHTPLTSVPNPYWIESESLADTDQADYQTITGLLKQYQQARKLVERNEVRGGILVPSFHAEDGVTFDTFFDANDQSFARYSVMESIVLPPGSTAKESRSDWIHTKLMLHLQEGGIKLSFTEPSTTSSDEYVLLTFNDVNLSSQLSQQFTEHVFTIGQLELEDAYTTSVHAPPGDDDTETLVTHEISTLLLFSPEMDGDDDEDADFLVGAPSVSLSIKTERGSDVESVSVELTLEPLEVSYRSAVIAKLTQMFKQNDTSTETMLVQPDVPDVEKVNKSLHFVVSCGSVAIELPCPVHRDWGTLYQRCGYITEGTPSRKSALGVTLDRVEMNFHQHESGDIRTNVSIQCHHIVAYTSSPKNTSNVFDVRTERFDILALCGRTEVDPCIPISVMYTEFSNQSKTSESRDLVVQSSAFPKVPSLSSFKARQDEDDDIHDGRASNLAQMKAKCRKELRYNDPQETMLSDVSTSNAVVSIHVPEIIGDISSCEWQQCMAMVDSLLASDSSSDTPKKGIDQSSPVKRVAVSAHCEFVSLAVHGDEKRMLAAPCQRASIFSFLMKMEDFKSHALLDGSEVRHTRVLAHEIDLFEVWNLCDSMNALDGGGSMHKRVTMLRRRRTCHGESTATPVLYRSHLFAPISRNSPCVLLDVLVASSSAIESTRKLVHFTLYDTTYRYNNDSRWYDCVASLIPKPEKATDSKHKDVDPGQSLSQTFISVVDFNVDYSSSPRFPTASRCILRIGDFRLSSNVVRPEPAFQACSVSVDDVAVYLCSSRYPYNFENRRLLGARATLNPNQITLAVIKLPDNVDAEDVLRRMKYKTVFTLDSCDALVSMSNAHLVNETDPPISVTLTIGQVCMFACKDSLSHLSRTVGELSTELTAITEAALNELKTKSKESRKRQSAASRNDKRLSVISGSSRSKRDKRHPDFLIDGYDWMTVDSDDCGKLGLSDGEDHAARWYGKGDDAGMAYGTVDGSPNEPGPRIISHHFPLHPVSDPIGDGDMGIAKFAGANVKTKVRFRLIVCDLAFKIHFFDGYDWPELIDESERNAARCDSFVIPIVVPKMIETHEQNAGLEQRPADSQVDRKSKLMGDLLAGADGFDGPFQNIPLPEEKKKSLKEQAEMRRLARRTNKCFQISASGVSVRLDSIEESNEHRLVSCLNLKVQDLFIAETISSSRPVKLLGEWFNEQEHPRDSNDGLVMLKMVTWRPLHRMTDDGKIANDESEVALKLLPLRCLIDQRAIAFARAFFNDNTDGKRNGDILPPHLHAVPPPLFTSFRVQSFKLKVDYRPQKLDTAALRNGSVIELINLSPLDAMILTLKEVVVANEVGFGAVMSILVQRWVQDICATQLIKFVANSRPLEPITEVSGAAIDMVILPWEAFRNGESIQKAIRSGTRSFSKTVVYELFNMSSRAAEYFAGNVARASASNQLGVAGGEVLPSRPLAVPKHVLDTGPHAMESIYRGLQAANYKIVIVPYREYHRTGASSAVRSVIKGIPVAIAAPASGAAEALSFALLGARNQIRPDIRKEEEASMKGLYLE